MAQVLLSEYLARKMYSAFTSGDSQVDECFLFDFQKEVESKVLLDEYFKIASKNNITKFVVKPNYTFGKRGINNLIGLNLSAKQAEEFIFQRRGSSFNSAMLNRFLVMPFYEHDSKEFYLSITTESECDVITVNFAGGVEVESNRNENQVFKIPVSSIPNGTYTQINKTSLKKILSTNGGNIFNQNFLNSELLLDFIYKIYGFFIKFGLSFLEVNPFVVIDSKIIPLDFKLKIDDSEYFRIQEFFPVYEAIESDSSYLSSEEKYIKNLDSSTSASLKLKLLNRNAPVWPMVAGGGASIIFFDSLVEKVGLQNIGLYGEYSGNPSEELVYEYTRVILKLVLESSAEKKYFLIAGANANFTDLLASFSGIERALKEKITQLKREEIRILFRRGGGPNYIHAFKKLRKFNDVNQLNMIINDDSNPMLSILEAVAL